MATEPGGDAPGDRPDGDPAADPRANYDYASDDVDRPALVDDLDGVVDGDVRFDSYSRQLYATDASAYEVTPIGVVFPRSTADVVAVVDYCAEREIPVLPRGGGTSLAGQSVNRAIVLDFTRYMNEVRSVDPDARTATVQPGTILGTLNERLSGHGLQFAPDPAWGDKSAIGGAIGNNSTGAHSLRYGKTDAYLESAEVVLADGTVARFGEVSIDGIDERADPDGDLEARIYAEVRRILAEEADAIEAAYPDLKRNVSGYNLDRLVAEARGEPLPGGEETGDPGTVNLARLLAGSEGTLAIVTEATVSLEPTPETKAVALLCYPDLHDATDDVAAVLEHDPAAVEVLDDVLLDLARGTAEFGPVADRLPEGTNATLLVEFYAADDEAGRERVAELLADRCPTADTAGEPPSDGAAPRARAAVRAHAALEAHAEAERAELWNLRKSGLPILLSRTTDEKHVSFIEDTAVPPERLPEFVERFEAILEANGTYASFYAHAGPGVLHVRPLVNTKTEAGLDRLEGIADEVTDLVVELGGSVSGEHGDGRARTQWNRKLYGERVWETFRSLKAAFDPDWLLNPGQVCGTAEPPEPTAVDDGSGPSGRVQTGGPDADDATDGLDPTGADGSDSAARDGLDPAARDGPNADDEGDADDATDPAAGDYARATGTDLRENLRFDPDYEFEAGFEPELEWETDNGFRGMVELCHGCGGCRGEQSTTGGVMCPTYRASREEITSTRGRANALRQAMSGDLPPGEAFTDEFVEEVVGLCIGCKGCAVDCPSEVDMAKLKAEVTHEYHRRNGASLRDRLFARVDDLSRIGSALAPLSNRLPTLPGARWLAERTVGIAADRPLPTFSRETFRDRFEKRGGPRVPESEARRRVVLYPDTYTNYSRPEAGMAAVEVLEAAGVRVTVPDGSSDTGRPAYSMGFLDLARERAEETVADLAPLVAEGRDVVVIEPSDAVMIGSDYRDLLAGEDVERVAAATYGICEYVDRFGLDAALPFAAPDETLTYHGHCHQKATKTDGHAAAVLRRAGYDVDALDSGCCGMAGSFGYEAEHASMSSAIAAILYEQVEGSDGDRVVAPGASCRTQLAARPGGRRPRTPIEELARALERDEP